MKGRKWDNCNSIINKYQKNNDQKFSEPVRKKRHTSPGSTEVPKKMKIVKNKVAINTYLSKITLNVNGLNAPIKRQSEAEWIKKQDP